MMVSVMSGIKNNPFGSGLAVKDVSQLSLVVRSKRKQDGLTQQNLAAIANVGVRFVSDLENGKATVQLDLVVAVLQALGLQLLLAEKF